MVLCKICREKRREEVGVWKKKDCELMEIFSDLRAFGQDYILGPINVLWSLIKTLYVFSMPFSYYPYAKSDNRHVVAYIVNKCDGQCGPRPIANAFSDPGNRNWIDPITLRMSLSPKSLIPLREFQHELLPLERTGFRLRLEGSSIGKGNVSLLRPLDASLTPIPKMRMTAANPRLFYIEASKLRLCHKPLGLQRPSQLTVNQRQSRDEYQKPSRHWICVTRALWWKGKN